MVNGKLAAAGNVPVDQRRPRPAQLSRLGGRLRRTRIAIARFDRKAQQFFTAHAHVRGRKVAKPQCGWQRYDSFC